LASEKKVPAAASATLALSLGEWGGGYSNFTGTNLTKWVAAKAARAAGTRNATVLAIGDSTTAGLGAGSTGGGDQNAIPFSWPNQLAGLMANSSASSMLAGHGQSVNFDSRIAINSGWATAGADVSVGGRMYATSGAGRLSFTPTNQVDTFVVKFITIAAGGLGTMNASIDAGATTLINEGLATGVGSQTFTTTLGNHTFNLDWVSGTVYVNEIISYNSAAKEISIYNGGWSSSRTTDWLGSTNVWNPFPFMATIAADLNIVDLTINDAFLGTGVSTYSTNLQLIITQLLPTGSVILMSGNPIDPVASSIPLATQAQYVAAMKALSVSNNVPMIDVFSLFGGTYANAVANGWVFGDGFHLNATGYAQIAGYVNRALASGFVSR
jgi:lysophospholipase L1-like esterase